jgi:hypothetical protein
VQGSIDAADVAKRIVVFRDDKRVVNVVTKSAVAGKKSKKV